MKNSISLIAWIIGGIIGSPIVVGGVIYLFLAYARLGMWWFHFADDFSNGSSATVFGVACVLLLFIILLCTSVVFCEDDKKNNKENS